MKVFILLILALEIVKSQVTYLMCPKSDVTAVFLTSHGRYDMLRECLLNFAANNDYPVQTIIVVNIGPLSKQLVKNLKQFPTVTVLGTARNTTRMQAIDKAYSLVKTRYVYFSQDNMFLKKKGLIQMNIQKLQTDPKLLQVWNGRAFAQGYSPQQGYVELSQKPAIFSFNATVNRMDYYRLLSNGYAGLVKGKQWMDLTEEQIIDQYYRDREFRSWRSAIPSIQHIQSDAMPKKQGNIDQASKQVKPVVTFLMDQNSNVSATFQTCCNRYDILKETLFHFAMYNDYPVKQIFVCNDGALSQLLVQNTQEYPDVNVITTGQKVGQVQAIDTELSLIKTAYVYESEDDHILMQKGLIKMNIQRLEEDPKLLHVMNTRAWIGDINKGKYVYWPNFDTFDYCPSVFRMTLYRQLANGYVGVTRNDSYGGPGGQPIISNYYSQKGYKGYQSQWRSIMHVAKRSTQRVTTGMYGGRQNSSSEVVKYFDEAQENKKSRIENCVLF